MIDRLEKLLDAWKKNHPRSLMLLFSALLGCGLVLYLLSGFLSNSAVKSKTAMSDTEKPEEKLSHSLELVLCRIPGAGKVHVILTISQEQELVFQTDKDSRSDGSNREETVLSGNEGVVKTKRSPVYQGALIACEGAESPSVVLAIRSAVKSLTGLSGDQISVIQIAE